MSSQTAQGWRFSPIDTWPRWQAAIATTPGQLALAAAASFACLSFLAGWESVFVVLAALCIARLPAHRPTLMFLFSWTFAWLEITLGGNTLLEEITELTQAHLPFPPVSVAGLMLLITLGLCALTLRYSALSPQSLLARRPLATLLGIEAGLIGLASSELLPPDANSLLWTLICLFASYLWFLPFAIIDQRSKAASPLLFQLGVQRPFWSPTYLPFGKGAAYLRKHEAKTAEALAISQLKGLKLLIWANALFWLRHVLELVVQQQLGLPTLETAVSAFLIEQPYPVAINWASQTLSTGLFCLQVASWAHCFIGIVRLAGYALPRGSWRPLESRTLMDYFNRFHFYFKELLVDLFFVPTFFRWFKGRPRLRMFFATFMAAGVGNALWHFLRDVHLVATQGLPAALESYTSYLFYCLVLATGIGLSQVRASQGKRPGDGWSARLTSFFFVWSFVVILHVFSDGSRTHTLTERLRFVGSLFGVF